MLQAIKYRLRFRHRRGHGIHSPFVYELVRNIFMPNINFDYNSNPYVLKCLLKKGLPYDTSFRLGQLFVYLDYKSVACDIWNGEDFLIVGKPAKTPVRDSIYARMRERSSEQRTVVLLLDLNKSCELIDWWKEQEVLRLDFYRFGVMIIDDSLQPQLFKLKI